MARGNSAGLSGPAGKPSAFLHQSFTGGGRHPSLEALAARRLQEFHATHRAFLECNATSYSPLSNLPDSACFRDV